MIEWDETDVLTCLGVEPVVDEQRVMYRYVTERNGVTLELTVCPYQEDVHVVLQTRGELPLVELSMRGCRAIRYVRHESAERLLFVSREERHFRTNLPYGMELQVAPSLNLRLPDFLTRSVAG